MALFDKLFPQSKPEDKKNPVLMGDIIDRFKLKDKPRNNLSEFRIEFRSYEDEDEIIIRRETYRFYLYKLQENVDKLGLVNRFILLYDDENDICIASHLESNNLLDFPLSILYRYFILNLDSVEDLLSKIYDKENPIKELVNINIKAQDDIATILGTDHSDSHNVLLRNWTASAYDIYKNLKIDQFHDVNYSLTMSLEDITSLNLPACSIVVSQRGDISLFHII